MRKITFTIAIILLANMVFAQKYFTKTGNVSFFSETPMENIEAYNRSASVVVDGASGAVQVAVLIKGFLFEKALMQEHFNENYLESGKYPKAVFKGKLENFSADKLKKDGTYTFSLSGDKKIRGVSKPVKTNAIFTVKNGAITAKSDFKVKPEDHNVEIPSVVRDKIAKEMEIKVNVSLEELKK